MEAEPLRKGAILIAIEILVVDLDDKLDVKSGFHTAEGRG